MEPDGGNGPWQPANTTQPPGKTAPVVWIVAGVATFLVLALGGICVAGGFILLRSRGKNPSDRVAAPDPVRSEPASGSPSPSTTGCRYRETPSHPPAGKQAGVPPAAPAGGPATRVVDIATNRGPITVRLDAAKAPCTVNSVVHLIQARYFDGARCHRLTTAGIFVLQCGDPSGTGTGGPGYEFDDENLPSSSPSNYPAGTVAMANAGPGTNGSQFFIVYRDTTLRPDYTIFGQVTGGLDVIQTVAAGGIDPTRGGQDGPPKLPLGLTRLSVS